MNYLHLLSWYYQDAKGENDARNFFEKLKTGAKGGIKFPLDCPFEVALVHCLVDNHWCVGVLVMPGTPGDDSIEQGDALQKWYEACAATPSRNNDTSPALRTSVEGTLQARYGSHYRTVAAFSNNTLFDLENNTRPNTPSNTKKKWWQIWK